MEIPLKRMIWGYPYFGKPSCRIFLEKVLVIADITMEKVLVLVDDLQKIVVIF